MNISFHKKNILVTGAGQGIGRGLVKKLVMCGANVFALSRTKEHLQSLKDEVPEVTTIVCDISDSKRVQELVAQHGPYHCLVNNAGVAMLEPFIEVTEESFDRSFNINVKGVIIVSQVVAKMMIENNIEGAIVNISSRCSKVGVKNHAVYCATKGALDAVTKVMAVELGNYGIRANCVNPTVVMTEMGKQNWSDPIKAKAMLKKIPLHKFPEVEDVLNAVIFLLSHHSKMINGVTLPVDGGALAN